VSTLRELIDEYAARHINATVMHGVGTDHAYSRALGYRAEAQTVIDEIDRRLAAIEQYRGTEATKIKAILNGTAAPAPLRSSNSCRRCGRWLEGDWNRSTNDAERAELQRQMDAGRCDACTAKEATS
jgi:hypothetical protein